MRVCIGGSFNPLHKGHKVLLKKAVQLAGKDGSVFIGLTSDEKAKKKGTHTPFEKRKETLKRFLSKENTRVGITIQPLFDSYGPTITGDFDAIVVSKETQPTAKEINKKRKQLGKKQLQIIVIPFVLADDNKPISSTRIRQKEIDENGKVLTQE
jgi:cytidyltransferase-like protein